MIPTGYSFNLDGTSIYLTMAAVFIAQATDTPMTLTQQLTLLVVLLLTSKGAAGVTGSGFIMLAATLSAVGDVPVAGLALILGIDRFMSEARALTNLIGNGVATLVVAKWTGDLDTEQLKVRLDNEDLVAAEETEVPLDATTEHLHVGNCWSTRAPVNMPARCQCNRHLLPPSRWRSGSAASRSCRRAGAPADVHDGRGNGLPHGRHADGHHDARRHGADPARPAARRLRA